MWVDEVMDDGVTLRGPNPEYFKQLSEKTMEDMVAGRDPVAEDEITGHLAGTSKTAHAKQTE
jgi:hypothetical protein